MNTNLAARGNPFSYKHLGDSDGVEILSKLQMAFRYLQRRKIGPDSTETPPSSVHQCDFSAIADTQRLIQIYIHITRHQYT